MEEYTGGSVEADHLCVLVHGLWGNPSHMLNIAKALRAQYARDQVYLLVAKRNSGSFTYDGIELGGERVCLEIEEELELIHSRGGNITKLSIVGYSLGGLVARYAIGLLHARGVLDKLECMSFTAFASPFLGVRTPLRGLANQLFNVVGARTLCMSGRQLFGIDRFRDTGKPLLAVLADPGSIFLRGLARFRRRTLYSNIVNDRSATYYTTCITKTDPYADLAKVQVRFLPGYDDVILDPDDPVAPAPAAAPAGPEPLAARAGRWARRVPLVLALTVFIPLGLVAFLVNSAVQTVRSARRVKLHESGLAGVPVDEFRRLDLWIRDLREAVEHTYENLNSAQEHEYLVSSSGSGGSRSSSRSSSGDEAEAGMDDRSENTSVDGERRACSGNGEQEAVAAVSKDDDDDDDDKSDASAADREILALERKASRGHHDGPFATLALAPYQFAAIQALDGLGWRKYPVWIRKHRHSHAAIIVRMNKKGFEEGNVVLKHWVTEEFLV
ncbi:hypothetical protein VTJ83DRAFT_7294 [Remersonia thermophila]|uniref:DUF676 domain-containing protein n=1 Tax=Remersonia thermophila TaxID=72144 RepID=A0ABR4D443_9PEZI